MIVKYEGQTLTNEVVEVDNCIFINCVIKECDLIYSGGDAEIVGSRIENCRYHFRGAAQKMIAALHMLGVLKAQPMPVPTKMEMGKAN